MPLVKSIYNKNAISERLGRAALTFGVTVDSSIADMVGSSLIQLLTGRIKNLATLARERFESRSDRHYRRGEGEGEDSSYVVSSNPSRVYKYTVSSFSLSLSLSIFYWFVPLPSSL